MSPLIAGAINPTKLYAPRRRPTLVGRPRLVDRVRAGIWRPLTLIVAPAGYGKTTLVSQWMAETDRPVAWLSLDEDDNDPLRFLAYLLAAVRRIVPEVGEGMDGIAPKTDVPDMTGLLTQTLLVPVSMTDTPLALVLDDFHSIHAKVVRDAVSWLIDHLPPSMHLLITTRQEPALSVPLWRARDQVTEIRRSDLEFDGTEAHAFLERAFSLDLAADVIARVRSRTEGWAAGLQLAGLSLAQGADVEQVLEALGEGGHVADYLIEEILQSLSASQRDFLLMSSVLDELDAGVCAEVTGVDDAARVLRELDRRGLFLIPLDHQRRKYRFHHLFGELLRARLEVVHPGRSKDLHRRTAIWHLERGNPHKAASHATSADDPSLMAQIVDRWGIPLVYRSDLGTVGAWLAALPDDALDALPGVGVATGWLAVLPLRVPPRTAVALDAVRRAREALERHERPTPDHWRDFAAQLTTIASIATRPVQDPLANVSHAQRTLHELGEDGPDARSVLALQIGVTHLMMGWPERALPALTQASSLGQQGGNTFAAVAAMGYRAGCLASLGRLTEGEAVCRAALAYAERERCSVLGVTSYVHARLARILLERWDLPGALEAFDQGLLRAQLLADPFVLVNILVMQARARENSGEPELAEEALAEAAAVAARAELPGVEGFARLGRLMVDVLRGQSTAASLPDPATYRGMTHEAALFALRAANASAEALPIIDAHQAAAQAAGRWTHAMDWEIEAVVALHRAGQSTEAIARLEAAVLASVDEGGRRVFAERSEALAPLLRGLSPRAVRALAGVVRSKIRAPEPVAARPAPAELPSLADPLTRREREVLARVAEGLSNPEIAKALFVSTGTVKTHMHRLLRKLGARNRLEAVRRATAHGLLA